MSEKIFRSTVAYLKMASLLGAVVCFLQMFFLGFDPWHGLDALIWNDLYGAPQLPELAKPAFDLMFLLFCWVGVLLLGLIFFITKYALAKKEKWAFVSIVLTGIFWPLGGAIISWYLHAWSYLISVAAVAIMFWPPLFMLAPFFREK